MVEKTWGMEHRQCFIALSYVPLWTSQRVQSYLQCMRGMVAGAYLCAAAMCARCFPPLFVLANNFLRIPTHVLISEIYSYDIHKNLTLVTLLVSLPWT